MIGMKNEDPVHGAGQNRVDLVFLARHRKAHVQEVGRSSRDRCVGYTKGWPIEYL